MGSDCGASGVWDAGCGGVESGGGGSSAHADVGTASSAGCEAAAIREPPVVEEAAHQPSLAVAPQNPVGAPAISSWVARLLPMTRRHLSKRQPLAGNEALWSSSAQLQMIVSMTQRPCTRKRRHALGSLTACLDISRSPIANVALQCPSTRTKGPDEA